MRRGPGTLRLQGKLLSWYAERRRDLPWRRTRDPYAIWLSEVMLQQTRVETVLPYYERFLSAFPSVHALAEAPLGEVLRLWSGLGYYRRARMLHAAAREVEEERGGSFPKTAAELLEIKGIGRYTAGAVASIAWGEAVAVVDGNVGRVLSRLFAIDGELTKGPGRKQLWELAESLVFRDDPSSWNQALMELGAVVCTPRHPRCASCPVEAECEARARGLTTELPRVRVRKAPALLRRTALVLGWRGRTLLGRRPEGGLFGGMWEPPQASEPEFGKAKEELVSDAMHGLRDQGVVTHVLSHRRIELLVIVGRARRPLGGDSRSVTLKLGRYFTDYEALEWVRTSQLHERPLSTLAKKVLRKGGVLEGSFTASWDRP